MKSAPALLIVPLLVAASACQPAADSARTTSRTWSQFRPDTTESPAIAGDVYLSETRYYNDDGSPREIVSLVEGAPGYRIVFDHEESTYSARANYYDEKDSLASYYRYDFTADYREQRYSNFALESDSLLYAVEFRYPSDTLRESGYIDDDGSFVWTYRYYLDDNGNEIRAEFKSGDEVIQIDYVIEDLHEDGKWSARKVVGPGGQIWYFETQAFRRAE